MGGKKHQGNPNMALDGHSSEYSPDGPELSKGYRDRHSRNHSRVYVGRTIGEARERPETKNERLAARKKTKQKKVLRVVLTIVGFIAIIAILIGLFLFFIDDSDTKQYRIPDDPTLSPTIEIVDEDAAATGGKITARMSEYVAQIEQDMRALGYTPVRAVLPTGTIREVDIYLDGYTGFIKTTTDRGAGVTAEDADRMLRYLAGQGIAEFQYIDVRIDSKAYWK